MSGSWSLAHAQRVFWRHPTPRIIILTVLTVVSLRLWLGQWTAWDALIPAVVVAVHPLTEWLIHVILLHWKPRKLGPLTLDTVAARDHRAHHRDPDDLPLIFIPLPTLFASMFIVPAIWWVITPTSTLALTGIMSSSIIAMFYEWTHFICHVPHTPRTAWMRERVRHHRLHHYKNERYWFGVTLHMADVVLGTRPEPTSVERSPTARALHGEAA